MDAAGCSLGEELLGLLVAGDCDVVVEEVEFGWLLAAGVLPLCELVVVPVFWANTGAAASKAESALANISMRRRFLIIKTPSPSGCPGRS